MDASKKKFELYLSSENVTLFESRFLDQMIGFWTQQFFQTISRW